MRSACRRDYATRCAACAQRIRPPMSCAPLKGGDDVRCGAAAADARRCRDGDAITQPCEMRGGGAAILSPPGSVTAAPFIMPLFERASCHSTHKRYVVTPRCDRLTPRRVTKDVASAYATSLWMPLRATPEPGACSPRSAPAPMLPRRCGVTGLTRRASSGKRRRARRYASSKFFAFFLRSSCFLQPRS